MLEPGDVDKIEVVNKKYARVYLRPGARGVPLQHRPGVNVMPTSSGGIPPSSQTITTKRRRDVDGEWVQYHSQLLGERVFWDARAKPTGREAPGLDGSRVRAVR